MHSNTNIGDADRLRERRLAAGLSQMKLASLAEVDVNTVRLLERGYRPAKSRARERVLRVLALLGDEEATT